MSRHAAAAGRTRSCPHCRETILESASVCPACQHHLRFEARSGEAAQPTGRTALHVAGQFHRDPADGPGEYTVVVVIRDAGGHEIARRLVGVGGLAPGEERGVELSVALSPPATAR